MAQRILPFNLGYRDAKGWVGRMRFFISDADGSAAIASFEACADTLTAAVSGLTNAALQSTSGLGGKSENELGLAYGANSEYPAEWMKAVMTFTTDDATISRFKVPAPKIAIFDTDGITVLNDGTQALVVAFVSAVKTADAGGAFVSTKTGLPYTHFVGGILRLGKQPKRFNDFIKSSHLVAGEGE